MSEKSSTFASSIEKPMKRFFLLLCAAAMLTACGDSEKQLKQRAAELCQYIPDHELLQRSQDYMTADFYALLDTMFYRLPEHEAMDHEWLYYFVTGNGGTIADYEVVSVEKLDADHAVATILVRQIWEDGTPADDSDTPEEHFLMMERVNGTWLMSDFDAHKVDCIRYIANNRKEQALRDAISAYLINEIGSQYAQGEICVPALMMVHETDSLVWGDFWIFWYNRSGDTLKTVSGGNHSGRMTIAWTAASQPAAAQPAAAQPLAATQPVITAFEQTLDGAAFEPSAKRIFGDYYDVYQNMHSNASVREAVRREQLSWYVRLHSLPVRYYQDFGWSPVALDD